MKTRIADGEARDRLIIWIRRRMDEFGITIEALAASIEHDRRHPPLYRDARGNEWNGSGQMPEWLQAAKHAGVDPDFFRIEDKRAAQGASTQEQGAAPHQMDLFA
jgi:DNA-binding protein H-NS